MATPPNAPVRAVHKPRILVDFDGVIHDIKKHPYPALGEPVMGAFEWLASLLPHFEIAIFSSRALQVGNVLGMKRWFRLWWPNSLPDIEIGGGELVFMFTAEKLPCRVQIDDRAYRFTGNFPTAPDLLDYLTWQEPQSFTPAHVEQYGDDLGTWALHLATSADSFIALAEQPCFGPAWGARFRAIADQIQDAALAVITALPKKEAS